MSQAAVPDELTLFFDNSPIALALAVPSGDTPLVLVNRGFRELTGYTSTDILGKNCRLLQGSAGNQSARHKLRAFLNDDEQLSIRTTILNFRKDGRPFVNLLYMSRLKSLSGTTKFFFASQFDVSRTQPERLNAYDTELGKALTHLAPMAAEAGLIIEGTLTTIANSAAAIAQAKLALADLDSNDFL